MIKTYRDALDAGFHTNKTILSNYKPPFQVNWAPFKNIPWNFKAVTGLPMDTLKQLATKLTTVPQHFKLHSRVEKIIADRRAMAAGTSLVLMMLPIATQSLPWTSSWIDLMW